MKGQLIVLRHLTWYNNTMWLRKKKKIWWFSPERAEFKVSTGRGLRLVDLQLFVRIKCGAVPLCKSWICYSKFASFICTHCQSQTVWGPEHKSAWGPPYLTPEPRNICHRLTVSLHPSDRLIRSTPEQNEVYIHKKNIIEQKILF